MGTGGGRCCDVTTLKKDKSYQGLDGPASTEKQTNRAATPVSRSRAPVKLKTTSEYKSSYTEKSRTSSASKVVEVVARDGSDGVFICRKLSLQSMPQKSLAELAKHCEALGSLEHPHLCKMVDCFQDAKDVLLIYEKADALTIFDHIRRQQKLTESDAAEYTRQVAMALSVAHTASIYHGRLTPAKLICAFRDAFDEEDAPAQVKICDFGQAYIMAPNPLEVNKVTGVKELTKKQFEALRYCASPELVTGELLNKVPAGQYPDATAAGRNDMWAFGAIVYHMLTGSPPFVEAQSQEVLKTKLTEEIIHYTPRVWKNLSEDARDAVEMMLKVNCGLRITAKSLLKHPWIKIAKTTFPRKRMVQLMQNLRLNCDRCEFTRFVLRVAAEQLPADGKQTETVEDAFRCLDGNSDGVLSLEEVIKGLRRYLDINEADLQSMFKSIDRDGSGTLNVKEFMVATMDERRALSLPILWQAFNAFDQDSSGQVSFDEIERLVKDIEGAAIGKARADRLCSEIRSELAQVDPRASGIDFDQFVYVMSNEQPNLRDAVKKDLFRTVWRCGYDCYDVRKQGRVNWKVKAADEKGNMMCSPRSAYRKRTNRIADKITEEAD
jgi:serine/threonine protein kinase